MFEHMRPGGARTNRLHRGALALALVLMFGISLALVSGVTKLMRRLGFFPGPRPPVQVSYVPYGDGVRLEQLLGPDEMPALLPELVVWEEELPSTPAPIVPEQPPAAP